MQKSIVFVLLILAGYWACTRPAEDEMSGANNNPLQLHARFDSVNHLVVIRWNSLRNSRFVKYVLLQDSAAADAGPDVSPLAIVFETIHQDQLQWQDSLDIPQRVRRYQLQAWIGDRIINSETVEVHFDYQFFSAYAGQLCKVPGEPRLLIGPKYTENWYVWNYDKGMLEDIHPSAFDHDRRRFEVFFSKTPNGLAVHGIGTGSTTNYQRIYWPLGSHPDLSYSGIAKAFGLATNEQLEVFFGTEPGMNTSLFVRKLSDYTLLKTNGEIFKSDYTHKRGLYLWDTLENRMVAYMHNRLLALNYSATSGVFTVEKEVPISTNEDLFLSNPLVHPGKKWFMPFLDGRWYNTDLELVASVPKPFAQASILSACFSENTQSLYVVYNDNVQWRNICVRYAFPDLQIKDICWLPRNTWTTSLCHDGEKLWYMADYFNSGYYGAILSSLRF
jgi:hypothetical protein